MVDTAFILSTRIPTFLSRLHESKQITKLDFDELDELRKRLLRARRHDQGETTLLVGALADKVRSHPRLVAADKRAFDDILVELRDSFEVTLPAHAKGRAARRPPGSSGRKPSHAKPPMAGASAMLDDAVTQNVSPMTPRVYWSTCVREGGEALAEPALILGRRYTLETGLGPQPDSHAQTEVGLFADIPDGTKITFLVSSQHAVLFAPDGAPSDVPRARVAWEGAYDAGKRSCGPASFGLLPHAAETLRISVALMVGNAVQCSQELTLSVVEASTPVRAQAGIAQANLEVSIITPRAEMRLELTERNRLVISADSMKDNEGEPAQPWTELIRHTLEARRELIALAKNYRRARSPCASEFALEDGAAACREMARIGAGLHRAFFGTPSDGQTDRNTQALASCIAACPAEAGAATLQIMAHLQPFPWAVFYDGAYRGTPWRHGEDVDMRCFWGSRFIIQRMIRGRVNPPRAPIMKTPVRALACVSETAARAGSADVWRNQQDLFVPFPGDVIDLRTPHIGSGDDFLGFLKSPQACDLIYLLCHASAAATRESDLVYNERAPSDQACLSFEPDPKTPLSVAEMYAGLTARAASGELAMARPLVFLNACSSVRGDEAFQSPMLELFLKGLNAVGVLGTDCEVPTEFADVFARRLFHHFFRLHEPIGAALWNTSQEAFSQGNPFPLLYALYAPPSLITSAQVSHA